MNALLGISNASLSAYSRVCFAYMFLHLTIVWLQKCFFFFLCLVSTLAFTALVSSWHIQSLPLFPFSSLLPPTSLLAWWQVGHLIMVVVVRANLLHQAVVRTVEGNIDTDDFKRLGANPGHVTLDLFLKAGLGCQWKCCNRPKIQEVTGELQEIPLMQDCLQTIYHIKPNYA